MIYTLGIDIGSGYSKAVVCGDGVPLSGSVVPSGGDYKNSARSVAGTAVSDAGISMDQVSHTVATGYGAAMVEFADRSVSDISCHAAGIHYLFPTVRTVVDIGHQFSKAVRLDEQGKAVNFVMNEKCAGGSGKFLQVVARILHVGLEELGGLSLSSIKPVEFTTGCAVFAESEAVSRIAEGAKAADIVAGVHKAMASKIANLITRLGLVPDFAVTGGGARDPGLVRWVAEELGAAVLCPEDPQTTGALGAALIAFPR